MGKENRRRNRVRSRTGIPNKKLRKKNRTCETKL